MRGAWVLGLATACGRVGFDAVVDDATARCESPFMQTETGCYAFVQTAVTWQQAKAACEGMNSHLAVILDATDNTALAARLPAQRMWIGLSDLEVEMTFVWVTGDPLGYTAWAGGEPNDDMQDCVEHTDFQQWNEFGCEMPRPYVCER